MKVNFCTLFNASYLSRGVVLYQSLEKYASRFHLYVIAFDEDCALVLEEMRLPNLTIIRLKDFENAHLLNAKSNRTITEYCWTCSSASIKYCIDTFDLENCTYIDADMEFFQDPAIIINRFPDANCIITPHRYSPPYDQSRESGKYCVQFVYFKKNDDGMKLLNWWVDSCIEWCYNRVEEGKFGDQKYLDRFKELGVGVYDADEDMDGLAPWNIDRYSVWRENNEVIATSNLEKVKFKPIFYHFHGLKIFSNQIVQYTGHLYELNKDSIENLYQPYVARLLNVSNSIQKSHPTLYPNGNLGPSPHLPIGVRTVINLFLDELKSSIKNKRFPNIYKRIRRHYYFSIPN